MFTKDYFSRNIPLFEKYLAKFKDKPNLWFLEIGCFEGMATKWLLDTILTNQRCYISVIDTFKGSLEHKDLKINPEELSLRFLENINYNPQVIIDKNESLDALSELNYHHTEESIFDFIYIDGSHVAKDVLADAVLSFPLLMPSGILIFDDYDFHLFKEDYMNPKIAIDAFLGCYKNSYKLLHKSHAIVIEKLPLDK